MEIPARPMLKPWYRVLAEGERILLEFGGTLVTLEGGAVERLLPSLLPLLDGTRTTEEIVLRLGAPVEPAVLQVLRALARTGAITGGPPLPPSVPRPIAETAALVAAVSPGDPTPALVLERLAGSRVGVVEGRSGPAGELAGLMRASGVGRVEPVAPSCVSQHDGYDLVLAAEVSLDCLEELNRAALSTHVPWLATLPYDGTAAWVGPLVIPGESCCWRCFRVRRASNSGYADEFPRLETVEAGRVSPPPLAAVVAGLAATVAVRWLAVRDPALPGAAWTLQLWPRLTLTEHVTYRVPRCPVCSGLGDVSGPALWAEEEAA